MIRTHFSAFTHFSVEAALAAYQGVVERGRRRSVAWVACSRRRSLVPPGLGPVSARVPRVRRRCVARRVGMASAHIKEQCTTTTPTTPSLGIRSRFPAGRRPTISGAPRRRGNSPTAAPRRLQRGSLRRKNKHGGSSHGGTNRLGKNGQRRKNGGNGRVALSGATASARTERSAATASAGQIGEMYGQCPPLSDYQFIRRNCQPAAA